MKINLFISASIIIFLFTACKKEKTTSNNTTNIENNNKLCFQYIMENSYLKEGEIFNQKDYIIINLTIKDGKSEGEYKISTDNNKTISSGQFIGTIKNNIITSIHTYTKGKDTLKDEFILKLETHQISMLGGEKELINNVSMFIDPAKGEYMMQLPKVDCK